MRTAIDLVGPDCPPLHVQSSPDSSRLFSMFTTADSGVPRFLCFSHTRHCVGILKIAYVFDCASYEDVLCMNVDQHDVNWLVVPFSTMNKTSNMMLTLFEKVVLI